MGGVGKQSIYKAHVLILNFPILGSQIFKVKLKIKTNADVFIKSPSEIVRQLGF